MADITIFGFTMYSVCDMRCDSKIISLVTYFRFNDFSGDEVFFLRFILMIRNTIFERDKSIAQQYFHYSRNLSTHAKDSKHFF